MKMTNTVIQEWIDEKGLIHRTEIPLMTYLKEHDLEPIRHGRWIRHSGVLIAYKCPLCRKFHKYDTPYCPHCGAKMDEDWEEPEINPCRGCTDYDGQGGCKSNGGCGAEMNEVSE